jgi:ribosomal protein S27E
MMLRITCQSCNHTGLTNSEALPRELRCWQCGTSRHVQVADGRRMISQAAFAEWLLGSGAAELA